MEWQKYPGLIVVTVPVVPRQQGYPVIHKLLPVFFRFTHDQKVDAGCG
jgi:hypothetical protein